MRYVTTLMPLHDGRILYGEGRDVLDCYMMSSTHTHARIGRCSLLSLGRTRDVKLFWGLFFYLHSRLLERATGTLSNAWAGILYSLSAQSSETQAQEYLRHYVPTNS